MFFWAEMVTEREGRKKNWQKDVLIAFIEQWVKFSAEKMAWLFLRNFLENPLVKQ